MALSYYYNFIVPTASNLRSQEEDSGKTPIDMEIKRGDKQEYILSKSQILVIVPRNLDGSDMKNFLRKISTDRSVLQGKPKEKPGNSTHRPMFVYFLEWNEETKTCNGLFDIPTIISSIWDRAADEIKLHHRPEAEIHEEIEREILDFQNKLHQLVISNPITKNSVRIVSIPGLPIEFGQMKEISMLILDKEVAIPTETPQKKSIVEKLRKFPLLE